MSNLTLHQYWRSSCSWRVRWAMNHKGIAYQSQAINLLKNEHTDQTYTCLNPSQRVPCLTIDGSNFGESIAIMDWLEETYPTPPLLPSDPISRLLTRQLAHTIACSTQPIQNLAVMRRASTVRAEQIAWAREWIQQGLAAYELILQQNNCAGTYSIGAQLSMADICLIPQCYNARRFDLDLAQFPNVKRITDYCMTLPDCQKSSPEQQEDATDL